MLRERTFETGTVTLNYAVSDGDGPPLVLIHGLSGRWQAWLDVMPLFALRRRLYAVDLRGHGGSGRVTGAYRVTDYAGDVVAWLRGVVGDDAVLVGHSLGAIVSIAVASEAPDLVRAAVLEDPPLGAFSDQRLAERAEYPRFLVMRELAGRQLPPAAWEAELGRLMPETNSVQRRLRAASLARLDPEVMAFVIDDQAKEGYALEERLGRIAAPVLLLQGNIAHGGALDDIRAARAAGLLADCVHVTLPELGHGLHAGDPLGFYRLVTDFLEAL
jgi:pimeloyl-ACP methyl ester carboxylesterase